MLVDEARWALALTLDDRPRTEQLVRTLLFRAVRRSGYFPDLQRLLAEAPVAQRERIGPWKIVPRASYGFDSDVQREATWRKMW